MSENKKYDVILLDVDGTLLNFDQAEADGMRVVLREHGFEPTEDSPHNCGYPPLW